MNPNNLQPALIDQHVSSASLHAAAPPQGSPDPTALEIARALLPSSVLEHKFRSHSFAAKLDDAQLAILSAWLNSGDSLEEVRTKIATPPPEGFGLEVGATTLSRLKRFFENAEAAIRVSRSMETAADILHDPDVGQVAPLREALSLLLYSRALEAAKNEAGYVYMESMLNLLTKLERLKTSSQSRPHREPAPVATTRHKVELSIVSSPAPARSPEPPKIVNITATPFPDSQDGRD